MKGLYFAVFIIAASLAGHASCQGIVETIVTSLFTNCTEVKNFLGVTYQQLANSTMQPSVANIGIYVYGNSVSNRTLVHLSNSTTTFDNTPFNVSLPTEVVIHGMIQNSFSSEINAIIDALIKKGGSNVLLVDSSQIIGSWYMYSSTAVRFIGENLGRELVTLLSTGYDKNKIHLTGFGLGAHIAGFIGKTFKNLTNQSLPWITGLDPSGPCFFNSSASERLDKNDAVFVDVIHTNIGVWGTTDQIGDVDFYPNSGDFQPNGILPISSHIFALYLYAESIQNVKAFPAISCKSWLLFITGGCSWNYRTNMGYGVNKVSYGNFHLSTNGVTPFSKGDAGIPPFNFFSWIVGLFV